MFTSRLRQQKLRSFSIHILSRRKAFWGDVDVLYNIQYYHCVSPSQILASILLLIDTMNCKEHYLPELELATGQVREALQAILYTILL